MGNCLKTQLKEVVNNDKLFWYDTVTLAFKKEGSTSINLNIARNDNVTLEIVGGSDDLYLSDNQDHNFGKKHTYSSTGYIFLNGTFEDYAKVNISSKEAFVGTGLSERGSTKYYMPTLEYCMNLNELNLYQNDVFDGDIGSLKKSGIKSINISSGALSFNVDDISGITTLQGFTAQGCWSVTGNIMSLVESPLTRLDSGYTRITGELSSFASTMAAKRNANDTLVVICNSKITLNGNVVENNVTKTITFDGAGGYTIA